MRHVNPDPGEAIAAAYQRRPMPRLAETPLTGPPVSNDTSPNSRNVGLGQLERAIEHFERGFRSHDIHMVEIRMSPWLPPIRGTPRVQKILRDMRFPE